MTRAPEDPAARRAVREFARRHHPDAGGDPAVFAAGIERLRRGAAAERPGASNGSVHFVRRPPGLITRLRRWWARRNRTRVN
ncbi:hypothetical protein GCM10027174_23440 [Salinifilum aidingensis]